MKLTISIDRASKKWAVFENDFKLIHGFNSYENEEGALKAAADYCASLTDTQPKVVYPRITKMRMW